MIHYLEGRSSSSDVVGSLSYETGVQEVALNEWPFGGRRGDSGHFLDQIPQSVSRTAIAIGLFVAVPLAKQGNGWGRKLFRELTNRMTSGGSTLGILEVDPFLDWSESETHYANEIEWRSKLYADEGWNLLQNRVGATEVERPFMFADLKNMNQHPVADLTFHKIDKATHRRHQTESDREGLTTGEIQAANKAQK